MMWTRGTTLVAALLCAGGAGAQGLADRDRSALFDSKLQVLDGRAAKQYANSARLQPKVAPPVVRTEGVAIPRYTGRYAGPFLAMAREVAREHDVPEDLFLRLVQQESGWNAKAVSHRGAIGLAQLMPGTAEWLRVDPHKPRQNLTGGARYLRKQYEAFGTWRLALAAYNAGPGAVAKHDGVPPYRETRNYVRIILGG